VTDPTKDYVILDSVRVRQGLTAAAKEKALKELNVRRSEDQIAIATVSCQSCAASIRNKQQMRSYYVSGRLCQ